VAAAPMHDRLLCCFCSLCCAVWEAYTGRSALQGYRTWGRWAGVGVTEAQRDRTRGGSEGTAGRRGEGGGEVLRTGTALSLAVPLPNFLSGSCVRGGAS